MKLDTSFGVGSVCGKLTIEEIAFRKKTEWGSRIHYRCKCLCGNTAVYVRNILKSGKAISCGCLRGQKQKHGFSVGGKRSPLYSVWSSMKARCQNKNNTGFKNYGGRGIFVEKSWKEFIPFKDWALKNGYKKGLCLDRKNNDGPYSSRNCHWTDRTTNNRNNRRNVIISAFGEKKYLTDWFQDKRCVVGFTTFYQRKKKGFSIEESLFSPPDRKKFSVTN